MALMVELSPAIERELTKAWGHAEIAKRVEEALILAAYHEGVISRGKVGELLEMSFFERENYLAERSVPYNYGPEEYEKDMHTLDRLMGPAE